jgi:hypothetical protein
VHVLSDSWLESRCRSLHSACIDLVGLTKSSCEGLMVQEIVGPIVLGGSHMTMEIGIFVIV